MLEFFYYARDIKLINNENKIAKLVRLIFHIIFSFIINSVMPFVYNLTFNKYKVEEIREKDKIIVSLTSFPARIDKIWICIETILRQSTKPDQIILWLAESQFDGIESLPEKLKKQIAKGVQVKFCQDIRSHKKYYYTMKEFPNDIVITLDDDVFYHKNTIDKLVDLNNKFSNTICCNRGHVIKLLDGVIAPYNQWGKKNETEIEKPSKMICPTGVAGVLYPPKSLHPDVFDSEVFQEICPIADDLWLKVMSLRNGTQVAKTINYPDPLFTINSTQKESLAMNNVLQNKNDEQLKALINKYEIQSLLDID